MNKIATFLYLVFFLLLPTSDCYSNDVVDEFSQAGWKVEKIGNDNDSFMLIKHEGIKSTLSLSHRTLLTNSELEYSNYVIAQKSSIEYLKNYYKNKHKDYDYSTIEVVGKSYKGLAFIVDPNDNFIQIHIFLTNGSQECWGLFNGSKEHWNETLDILKK